jgi:hypothetical protein
VFRENLENAAKVLKWIWTLRRLPPPLARVLTKVANVDMPKVLNGEGKWGFRGDGPG